MKNILQFNIEDFINSFINIYKKEFIIFLSLFFINILIYGQKLFFTVLAPDDYYWFYEPHIRESASWLGRWAETLFNQEIFTSQILHILPYFNGLTGIFIITLSAFLTTKILELHKTYEIIIVTLLISATPYFAHFLYFNLIISAWIGILLSVIGVLLLYKQQISIKIIGFIFIVFAIGTYQAILQVIVAIVILKTILNLLNVKNIREIKSIIFYALSIIILTLLAFIVSNLINHLYLLYHNLQASGNYAKGSDIVYISTLIERIIQTYNTKPAYLYFNGTYESIFNLLFIIIPTSIAIFFIHFKQKIYIKIIILFFLIATLVFIPLVSNLPLLAGTYMPIRSQFVVGWFTAGAFLLVTRITSGLFRSTTQLLFYFLIAVNIYYIEGFYYAAQRQTQSDFTVANRIVTLIRSHQQYTSEPIKFKIIGTKMLSVEGWKTELQAFATNWSHYWIFKHFTNLKFDYMNDEDYKKIEKKLIQNGQKITSYPSKNALYIDKNQVVLFLNPNEINAKIKFYHSTQMTPDVNATFHLKIDKNKLIYYKSPCTQKDIEHTFFLHIYPKNINSLPEKFKKYGFENLDFKFYSHGMKIEKKCVAERRLPSYPIKKIATGQYHGKTRDWEINYNFSKEINNE